MEDGDVVVMLELLVINIERSSQRKPARGNGIMTNVGPETRR